MNASRLRSAFAALLAILSFGAYLFLNSVEASGGTPSGPAQQDSLQGTALPESEDEATDKAVLPDVELFKHLLQKGTEHLPVLTKIW